MLYFIRLKKIAILLLLSAGLSFGTKAQSLESFFTSGAIWTELKRLAISNSFNGYYAHRYYIASDTVINGQTYKKVNSVKMDVMEQSTNSYSHVQQYVDNGLFGAIRTTGQKVYFMRLANLPGDMPQSSLNNRLPINFEVPLYDYSVQIGDTVPWKYGNKVVQAIDYIVTTEGSYVRRIKFGQIFWSDDHWYEGLGGSYGLFSSYQTNELQGPLNRSFNPLCYNGPNHNYTFTTNSPLYLCSGISGLADEFGAGNTQTEFAISIYPNPAYSKIINIKTTGQNLEQVYLTDITGKKINTSFTNNSGEITLRVTDEVNTGMYLVHLQTSQGKLYSQKLILLDN